MMPQYHGKFGDTSENTVSVFRQGTLLRNDNNYLIKSSVHKSGPLCNICVPKDKIQTAGIYLLSIRRDSNPRNESLKGSMQNYISIHFGISPCTAVKNCSNTRFVTLQAYFTTAFHVFHGKKAANLIKVRSLTVF